MQNNIKNTYADIREILIKARREIAYTVNFTMVQVYWNIGRKIIEEEQHGKRRAEYGKELIKTLASLLTDEFGKGFSEQSLRNMRQFYDCFSIRSASQSKLLNRENPSNTICSALRSELSWTHYKLLLRIKNPKAREWYMNEAADCNWSIKPQADVFRTERKFFRLSV